MIALTCPNCNAELELDINREYATCTHCGTKVQLVQTVKVIHESSIPNANDPVTDLRKKRIDELLYFEEYDQIKREFPEYLDELIDGAINSARYLKKEIKDAKDLDFTAIIKDSPINSEYTKTMFKKWFQNKEPAYFSRFPSKNGCLNSLETAQKISSLETEKKFDLTITELYELVRERYSRAQKLYSYLEADNKRLLEYDGFFTVSGKIMYKTIAYRIKLRGSMSGVYKRPCGSYVSVSNGNIIFTDIFDTSQKQSSRIEFISDNEIWLSEATLGIHRFIKGNHSGEKAKEDFEAVFSDAKKRRYCPVCGTKLSLFGKCVYDCVNQYI